MKETDLAYIAGIVDGEGSIHISNFKGKVRKIYIRPRISISNSDIRLLLWIKKKFECGSISKSPIYGKGQNPKPVFQFHVVSRSDITKILMLILPYLKVKRTQAEIMLSYIHLRNAKIANFKNVGWGGGTSPAFGKEEVELSTKLKQENKRFYVNI